MNAPAFAPAFNAYGYAQPAYPLVASPFMGYDIIGQNGGASTTPAEPGMLDKTKTWLGTETMGVKRGYLLGGAALAGLVGYYGYTQGWFGKKRR